MHFRLATPTTRLLISAGFSWEASWRYPEAWPVFGDFGRTFALAGQKACRAQAENLLVSDRARLTRFHAADSIEGL
jgi:hypothetical protein